MKNGQFPPECCRQEVGSNHSFDLSVLFFSRTEVLLSLSQRPWSFDFVDNDQTRGFMLTVGVCAAA
jgi:hypothetical protein